MRGLCYERHPINLGVMTRRPRLAIDAKPGSDADKLGELLMAWAMMARRAIQRTCRTRGINEIASDTPA